MRALLLTLLAFFGVDTFTGVNPTGVTIQMIGGGSGPQCSDGIDNDGDGFIDFPADPGCSDANDNDEVGLAAPTAFSAQCSDGADNNGDGLIDWFGNDTGGGVDAVGLHGDPGCPTPNWTLGECRTPDCAPASNAPGVGLASISPAVPAWPGAYKNAGTGGCPAGNTISSSGVYSYCSFSGLTVTAQNVTCYGCRVRASGDSADAIHVTVANSNFRFVYGLVEPTAGGSPPWGRLTGYQFAMQPGNNSTAAAPWMLERSTVRGWGNAINLDGSGCNATHPCTIRGVTIGYPRDDAQDGGTSGDHTDGIACTSTPGTCAANYVTSTGNTLLGWIVHTNGTFSTANTNGIGLQGSSTYDHFIFTRNYISGWNASIDLVGGASNMLFANNYFGSEWMPSNNIVLRGGFGSGSNVWGNNHFNYTTDGTWRSTVNPYPVSSDDNKFWLPSDQSVCFGGSNANGNCSLSNGDSNCPGGTCSRYSFASGHTTDYLGNTTFPYPEPQCNDGLDNDGDGNIDYPWDSGCTDAFDNSE